MYKVCENEMVICPYNRYHVVSKLRIQGHIMKCKRNYPDVELASCLYNYAHKLKPEDMLEHYQICPQKARLEECRYNYVLNLSPQKSPENDDSEIFSSKPYPHSVHYIEGVHCNNPSSSEKYDSDEGSTISKISDLKNKELVNEDCEISSDESEDLEPLPLPKTTSKAFTCFEQAQTKYDNLSPLKGFGRGNLLKNLSLKIHSQTHHWQVGVNNNRKENNEPSTGSEFLLTDVGNCDESLTSDIPDSSTFKSDEFILEDEYDEDGDDFYSMLKGLDKYVKI